MKTLKVKPWGEGQGDHVLIDAQTFDPELHTLLDEVPAEKSKPARKSKPTYAAE